MTAHLVSKQDYFEILFNLMQRIYTLDVILLIIKQNTITRAELIKFLKQYYNIPSSSAYRYLSTLIDNKLILFSKTTYNTESYTVPRYIQTLILKLMTTLNRKNIHTTPTTIRTTYKGIYVEYTINSQRQRPYKQPNILIEPEP